MVSEAVHRLGWQPEENTRHIPFKDIENTSGTRLFRVFTGFSYDNPTPDRNNYRRYLQTLVMLCLKNPYPTIDERPIVQIASVEERNYGNGEVTKFMHIDAITYLSPGRRAAQRVSIYGETGRRVAGSGISFTPRGLDLSGFFNYTELPPRLDTEATVAAFLAQAAAMNFSKPQLILPPHIQLET